MLWQFGRYFTAVPGRGQGGITHTLSNIIQRNAGVDYFSDDIAVGVYRLCTVFIVYHCLYFHY